MKNTNMKCNVDTFNYNAIEWLEQLGNASPTEGQIHIMETLLRVLSLLLPLQMEFNKFKELVNPGMIHLLSAIKRNIENNNCSEPFSLRQAL